MIGLDRANGGPEATGTESLRRGRVQLRDTMRRLALMAGLASALALVGCAPVTPGTTSTPADPGGTAKCDFVVSPSEVILGGTMLISRQPAPECLGLAPGSLQTFELRSAGQTTIRVAEVQVAADGSFAVEAHVPTDTPTGGALLTAVPPVVHYCSDLDCPLSLVNVFVRHAKADTTPLTLVGHDLETPPLPPGADAYALPGPEPGQLTLVIIGNGCLTVPDSYVHTAGPTSLEIVSKVSAPHGDGCTENRKPWTSVIAVPDAYAGFTTVKVDNVEAELLGPIGPAAR